MRIANLPVSVLAARLLPTRWDLLVVPLLLVVFVVLGHGARQMAQPLTALNVAPLTLDPTALPGYALRTTLRMLAALVLSIIFTFTYARSLQKVDGQVLFLYRCSTFCSRYRYLVFSRLPSPFSWDSFPATKLGANARRYSRSLPVRPGTWASALSVAALGPARSR